MYSNTERAVTSPSPILDTRGRPYAHRDIPPLRPSPFDADEFDPLRVDYVRKFWHSQDGPLRLRDRQIEHNVRVLCGQQWVVFSKLLNKFVDIGHQVADETGQEDWRQRPVLNVMLYWFVLTHARMTENPPIISFLPASGDRIDAELAEVMDVLFKIQWSQTGMIEVLDRLCAWLIPGGSAYLKSRIDPLRGELVTFQGPGMLQLLDAAGNPILAPDGMPIEREVPDVAFDRDGNPLTQLQLEGDELMYGEPQGARPHTERKGTLAVDALSPLECRGSWGPTPWHQKRWHCQRSFLSPEEVWELYKLDVEPDIEGGELSGPGELSRLLTRGGFYGSANGDNLLEWDGGSSPHGWVSVYELWQAPCDYDGMEETQDSPGGRLMVIAGDKVARDGVRPGRFKYGSPIRKFDFINLPGRPSGTSMQEMMNPVQDAFNRQSGQIFNHAALNADPKALIHDASGIDADAWNSEPGEAIAHSAPAGIKPVEYVAPPAMGEDAWRVQDFLLTFMRYLGQMEGAEGRSPTRNASGELTKELRFNSDRPIAATIRRAAHELGRMADDWMVLLPIIMDEEEIITHAGEDSVTRTLTVLPHIFESGHVNVQPDPESMLPEGRGERQERIWQMWQAGAFGPPLEPAAIRKFMEMARFPHLGRSSRPGGVARITAEQENGRLARGVSAQEIPVFEWYDDDLHISVLEEFMASPDYLKLPPEIQQEFVIHRAEHQLARYLKLERALQEEQALAASMPAPAPAASGSGKEPDIADKSRVEPSAAAEADHAPRSAPAHATA